ncbi:PREDICTED: perlucin-like [Bactrocera latifrons]|uniref:perlucin-like n=1 Tax=Bactrocera latifrons TaxID=174628 RepID=UPI0008DD138E|nr:PREDICTED: perlucin-like [Bactrocera latifrons]
MKYFGLLLAALIGVSFASPYPEAIGVKEDDWRGNLQQNGDYYVSHNPVSWFAANYFCYSNGWSLVAPSSFTSDLLLKGFIELFGLTQNNYWTAGNRLANETTWLWGLGGNSFAFTNWAASEPVTSGDCLLLQTNTIDILWANQDCGAQNGFICQKTVSAN